MKEMSQITNADARRRVQECRALIDSFKSNDKCKEAMEEWQMSLDSEPSLIKGHRISAGKMVMGKMQDGNRVSFDIESCQG